MFTRGKLNPGFIPVLGGSFVRTVLVPHIKCIRLSFRFLNQSVFGFWLSFSVPKNGLGFGLVLTNPGWNQQLTNWLVNSTVLTQQIEYPPNYG
jgi:hypothetical protein